jgi:hypothetical protein
MIRRWAAILVGLCLAVMPAGAGQDRAWTERGRWLRLSQHYALGPAGRQFMIALLYLENGPPTNPWGHDSDTPNLDVICPVIPAEDRRSAQAFAAFHRALEGYALRNGDWHRKEFWKYFAKFYHSGGPGTTPEQKAQNNAEYARLLAATWERASVFVRLSRTQLGESIHACEEGGLP